jgi:FkbM family methyltransferase
LEKTGIYQPLLKLKKRFDRIGDKKREAKNHLQRMAFYKKFLNPGDLVYDVGANTGNRVKAFLDIGCKVVAIEPQQECYEALEKVFGNSIAVVKLGLGAEDAEKTMYIADESTISSLSEEWIERVKQERFKQHNWNKTIKIKITTLDKLIQQYGLPVFCKIDVEGYEYEVLKGLTHPVTRLSLEYTVPEQTGRLVDCIQYCLNINPRYRFNYAVAENMQYQLADFMTGDQFLQFIKTPEFIDSGFGDIYLELS